MASVKFFEPFILKDDYNSKVKKEDKTVVRVSTFSGKLERF